MMKNGKLLRGKALLFALPLWLAWADASAGSWMRSQGEYSYSASLSFSTADQRFDQDSQLQPKNCVSRGNYLNQSMEYGASYYRTWFGSFSLANKQCGDYKSFETGDLELGMRGRIKLFQNGRSWEAALLIPTSKGSEDPERLGVGRLGLKIGAYGHFKLDSVGHRGPALSTGAELRLFGPDTFSRFRLYTDYSRRIRGLGFSAGLSGDFALPRGEVNSPRGADRFRGDYDKVSADMSLRHEFGEWAVSYHLSKAIWGRNTDDSTSISIGISRTWTK